MGFLRVFLAFYLLALKHIAGCIGMLGTKCECYNITAQGPSNQTNGTELDFPLDCGPLDFLRSECIKSAEAGETIMTLPAPCELFAVSNRISVFTVFKARGI